MFNLRKCWRISRSTQTFRVEKNCQSIFIKVFNCSNGLSLLVRADDKYLSLQLKSSNVPLTQYETLAYHNEDAYRQSRLYWGMCTSCRAQRTLEYYIAKTKRLQAVKKNSLSFTHQSSLNFIKPYRLLCLFHGWCIVLDKTFRLSQFELQLMTEQYKKSRKLKTFHSVSNQISIHFLYKITIENFYEIFRAFIRRENS